MLEQLLISTVMVFLTVAIHGLGLLGLGRFLRMERKDEIEGHLSALSARGLVTTFIAVLGVFVIHAVEIWLYALVFLMVDGLPDLESAVYFSTITYGTVGYNDIGLDKHWRLVAAIEGVNGVLLIGWSTAFFIALAARLRLR